MDIQSTLAEIVVEHPSAARLFHQHRLEFCCGGSLTLAEACGQAGVDPYELARQIEADSDAETLIAPEQMAPESLVDFIIVRFHEPLREELERLGLLAQKVEEVHADKPECPRGLAAHLGEMRLAMDDHLAKEEQILFPMIRAGRGHLARMPVQVMMQEHDDHGAALRHTRALTDDLRIPADACGSWRALYGGLLELELDLMRHIHLENNVLFPAVLGR